MGSNKRCHRVGLEESIKKGALMLKWESPACFEGMRPPPAPLLRVGDCPWRTGEGCPGSERARQSPAIEGAVLPAVASLQTAPRANGKTNSPCCLPACPPPVRGTPAQPRKRSSASPSKSTKPKLSLTRPSKAVGMQAPGEGTAPPAAGPARTDLRLLGQTYVS